MEYKYRLLKNDNIVAEITCPYDEQVLVRELAMQFFDENADLVVMIENNGKYEHFFTMLRDTTCDGLILCPRCSNEMSSDKDGQYCPECDYRE